MLSSHKNNDESFGDGACQCVKIWTHHFDITRSRSQRMKSVIIACFRHSTCCLSYVRYLASSETLPQCTGHASFYRAMRGIAALSRPSVRPSVCDVDVPWAYVLV